MSVDVGVLKGCILIDIDCDDCERIIFTSLSGHKFRMYHDQNCCESVTIEDVCGDWNDLLYEPLLTVEERIDTRGEEYGSSTTTFYEFATIKGSVTVRWYGSSNGYYSESVDFEMLKAKVHPVRAAVAKALESKDESSN
jgi:hypothetical protein